MIPPVIFPKPARRSYPIAFSSAALSSTNASEVPHLPNQCHSTFSYLLVRQPGNRRNPIASRPVCLFLTRVSESDEKAYSLVPAEPYGTPREKQMHPGNPRRIVGKNEPMDGQAAHEKNNIQFGFVCRGCFVLPSWQECQGTVSWQIKNSPIEALLAAF